MLALRTVSPEDRAALEAQLVARLQHLRSYAMSICHDESRADDLVQQTCLLALDKLHLFAPDTNFVAWLITILRNCYYNGFRQRKREIEWTADMARSLEDSLQHARGGEEQECARLDFARAVGAVGRLRPEARDALLCIGTLGMTYAATARHLREWPGTIKSRASRAREQASRVMEEGSAGMTVEQAWDSVVTWQRELA